MRRLTIIILACILIPLLWIYISPYFDTPVLKKYQYELVETLETIDLTLGNEYKVIIAYDGGLYYGKLNNNKDLIEMEPRRLKICYENPAEN